MQDTKFEGWQDLIQVLRKQRNPGLYSEETKTNMVPIFHLSLSQSRERQENKSIELWSWLYATISVVLFAREAMG